MLISGTDRRAGLRPATNRGLRPPPNMSVHTNYYVRPYELLCPSIQLLCPSVQLVCPSVQLLCPSVQLLCPSVQLLCPSVLVQLLCRSVKLLCPSVQIGVVDAPLAPLPTSTEKTCGPPAILHTFFFKSVK
jgi:hypothetical protein